MKKIGLRPLSRGLTLFIICLIAAACIHIIGLILVEYFPLSLSKRSFFKKSQAEHILLSPEDQESILSESQEIKEFFHPALLSPHALEHPFDLETLFLPKIHSPIPENFRNSLFTLQHFFSSPKEVPTSEEFVYNHPILLFSEKDISFLPWDEKFQIFSPSHLEIDFLSPPDKEKAFALVDIEEQISLEGSVSLEEKTATPPIVPLLNPTFFSNVEGGKEVSPLSVSPIYSSDSDTRSLFSIQDTPSSVHLSISTPLDFMFASSVKASSPLMVEFYDLPSITEEIEWGENSFEVKTYLMAHPEEGKGFFFSVVLQPCLDSSCQPFKQNFYFLIDRTTSVEKHRYEVFKKAVLKALAYLNEGDKFNIYVLDKKCHALGEENLPFNRKTIKLAEQFLAQQEFKGFFSSGDIYEALDKIPWELKSDKEIHTAILLTDGKTSLNRRKQQKLLELWSTRLSGVINLYTAAAGRENNLMLLEHLSSRLGGKLLYSETHAAFPRKLAKLVLTLKQPLLKEVRASAVPLDCRAQLSLYPSSEHLPTLCGQHPYVIYGSIDKLSDFNLILQGRNQDQMVTLKIPISLDNARKGGKALEKKWAVYQANNSFEKFMLKGKNNDLKNANAALKPYGQENAYE